MHDDPELGPGWAYFVDEKDYLEQIAKHTDTIEVGIVEPTPLTVELTHRSQPSACDSSFNAIERATSKRKDGYSVTGVGAVICSRSGIVRPNGVGDLKNGERYASYHPFQYNMC